ncbi:MAG: glycosyltransferase family 4 protein [Gammaproteobacteria bacterium]|nr:glycosyltransferase family 4 protein [Gammaproteobacteria bacterium]
MAESLAEHGLNVDIVMNIDGPVVNVNDRLAFRPASKVNWSDYDAVKTVFHGGFDYLEQLGGDDHPLIISKLGSVVGHIDDTEGVYFFGPQRQTLYETQQRIAAHSHFVTILTDTSIGLWYSEHPDSKAKILKVPTGIRPCKQVPGHNPYRQYKEKVVVYIGNLYNKYTQRSVNILWQMRLTAIGRKLKEHGIALVVIGPGESDLLNPDCVRYLGPVANDEILPYMYYADAGLVLAQGQVQHNESSKIYDYLAAGIPVISEEPVPNNAVIREQGHGYIAAFGDDDEFTSCLIQACTKSWDRQRVREYMAARYSWYERARTYLPILNDR